MRLKQVASATADTGAAPAFASVAIGTSPHQSSTIHAGGIDLALPKAADHLPSLGRPNQPVPLAALTAANALAVCSTAKNRTTGQDQRVTAPGQRGNFEVSTSNCRNGKDELATIAHYGFGASAAWSQCPFSPTVYPKLPVSERGTEKLPGHPERSRYEERPHRR